MGETMEQRIELAMTLREIGVDSVPINILVPIPGTPMQDMPPISEDEIMRTVAVFRFILPDKFLRFAGGRARLSDAAERRILTGGMNRCDNGGYAHYHRQPHRRRSRIVPFARA